MEFSPILWRVGFLACVSIGAACQTSEPSGVPIGVSVQTNLRTPQPWRALSANEQAAFDLGYAVFNTNWSPAHLPAGRRDGLGPMFNASSCDSCHNSRRRGRGPTNSGEAPLDLVIQLGRRLPDNSIQRGSDEYGFVLNTSATNDNRPEATVSIRYSYKTRTLADGTEIDLYTPHYKISNLSGSLLPESTVLMPRMPPPVQGVGLLEAVPERFIVRATKEATHKQLDGVVGKASWITTSHGVVIGRFGWQASEPSVASQTANAFAREMGLTTSLIDAIDCGAHDYYCRHAANGGTPEVEPDLLAALVQFQQLHAVPIGQRNKSAVGELLFKNLGCTTCHRPTLPVTESTGQSVIHAYTDLLLHNLGEELADHDLQHNPVHSTWRTAPLWGMNAAINSGQPLRLLHDGRARSIEEAILWHDGEGRAAQERYARLSAVDRQILIMWLAEL